MWRWRNGKELRFMELIFAGVVRKIDSVGFAYTLDYFENNA